VTHATRQFHASNTTVHDLKRGTIMSPRNVMLYVGLFLLLAFLVCQLDDACQRARCRDFPRRGAFVFVPNYE